MSGLLGGTGSGENNFALVTRGTYFNPELHYIPLGKSLYLFGPVSLSLTID